MNADGEDIKKKVSLVIGPLYSSAAIVAAFTAQMFGIPSISSSATSTALSNKDQYGLFTRIISPDAGQGATLVKLLQHFDWRRCAILTTDNAYGTDLAKEFISRAQRENVTVALSQSFTSGFAPKTELELIKATGARIIILVVVGPEDSALVFKTAEEVGLIGDRYTWMGTDAWTTGYTFDLDTRRRMRGTIGLKPLIQYDSPEYQHFNDGCVFLFDFFCFCNFLKFLMSFAFHH
jgi:ABC-type branched-subunit amino acid transport system substrate-binding protein